MEGCLLSSKYLSYIKFNRFDFFTHSRQLKIGENLEKLSKSALKDLCLLFSSYSVEREVQLGFVLRKIIHLAPQGESHVSKKRDKERAKGRWVAKSTHPPQVNEKWVTKSMHPCAKRRTKWKKILWKSKVPKVSKFD